MERIINLNVNQECYEVMVGYHESLFDILHNKLGLKGIERGYVEEDYEAYTVIMGGRPVDARFIEVAEAEGEQILTMEGLEGTHRHPLQDGFMWLEEFQCGFCAPGMLMPAQALLTAKPCLTEEETKNGVLGNISF